MKTSKRVFYAIGTLLLLIIIIALRVYEDEIGHCFYGVREWLPVSLLILFLHGANVTLSKSRLRLSLFLGASVGIILGILLDRDLAHSLWLEKILAVAIPTLILAFFFYRKK
ncbi:MAG: hypothetical protein LBQ78_06265 [Tannerellaceae bacterium]|jgi:hypothetical protein|nr:hypothetical protein [Tannerellaceae bacterium]